MVLLNYVKDFGVENSFEETCNFMFLTEMSVERLKFLHCLDICSAVDEWLQCLSGTSKNFEAN